MTSSLSLLFSDLSFQLTSKQNYPKEVTRLQISF